MIISVNLLEAGNVGKCDIDSEIQLLWAEVLRGLYIFMSFLPEALSGSFYEDLRKHPYCSGRVRKVTKASHPVKKILTNSVLTPYTSWRKAIPPHSSLLWLSYIHLRENSEQGTMLHGSRLVNLQSKKGRRGGGKYYVTRETLMMIPKLRLRLTRRLEFNQKMIESITLPRLQGSG